MWSDTAWVAGVNHNKWMNFNNKTQHDEYVKTRGYTGNYDQDRIRYVELVKKPQGVVLYISGENCLSNYQSSHNPSGKTINEISTNVANEAFKQWKSSKFHNENMLYEEYIYHGTAFCLFKDEEWGIKVFGSDLLVGL